MTEETKTASEAARAALARYISTEDSELLGELEAERQRLQAHVYGRYDIAIINAVPKERAAVAAVFGEISALPTNGGKTTLGVASVEKENGHVQDVVIANVTDQGLSQTAAATAALSQQLPLVRSMILVGIAAGRPDMANPERDIRLGDVVVADRIVQYDHVKRNSASNIECRGLNIPAPSPSLLATAKSLKAEFEMSQTDSWSWEKLIDEAGTQSSNWARPAQNLDPHWKERSYTFPNHYRANGERPHLHIGTIGSANTLLKDGKYRDSLFKAHKAIAFEMEGAGLAITAPIFDAQYIVVRGICDYGDQEKNDDWQKYASVGAAAVAKRLIAKR